MPAKQKPESIRPKRPAHIYLYEWLEHLDITAEQLAGRLETGKSVISKLMNNRQRYNQDWLEAIAYALDIEVKDLYSPPPDPDAPPSLDKLLEKAPKQQQPLLRQAAAALLEQFAKGRTGTDG